MVTVYDSLYDLIDDNITKILRRLFGPKVEMVVNNKGKQDGIVDFLQLRIAFCWQTIVAQSKNFDQGRMR